MTYPHKTYFKEPTKAAIKECVVENIRKDLVDKILQLEEGHAVIIDRPLIPPAYSDAKKFLKHAPEVEPTYAGAVIDIVRDALMPERLRRLFIGERAGPKELLEQIVASRIAPYQLRQKAFDAIGDPYFAGYSFQPFPPGLHNDNRIRRVSLVECVEGARIYAYTHQVAPPIDVEHYHDSRAAAKDGATFPLVRVPSRRKRHPRYAFDLVSVPVVHNLQRFKIGWNIASFGHNCERKLWHFRYSNTENSNEFVFCAHEIAAYRQVADEMWAKGKQEPMVLSPFVQPTTLAIQFYKRLLDSVLMRDDGIAASDHLRPLNKAEEEIMLWALVQKYKHDQTMFRPKGGTLLKDEDWKLRHVA